MALGGQPGPAAPGVLPAANRRPPPAHAPLARAGFGEGESGRGPAGGAAGFGPGPGGAAAVGPLGLVRPRLCHAGTGGPRTCRPPRPQP